MVTKKYSLIDRLCDDVHCAYVSDLTNAEMNNAVAKASRNIKAEDFSDSEWIKTAEYISLGKTKFNSLSDAREFLLKLK